MSARLHTLQEAHAKVPRCPDCRCELRRCEECGEHLCERCEDCERHPEAGTVPAHEVNDVP